MEWSFFMDLEKIKAEEMMRMEERGVTNATSR